MAEPAIGVISGTPNTGLDNSAAFIRDVDPLLYFYETDKHPIASMILTGGMELARRDNAAIPKITGKSLKKQGSKNVKIEFLEDDTWLKREYTPTATVSASATSITVSSSDDDHFRANDVLLLTNASGQRERVKVSSVTSLTLNVVNTDGTTRSAGIAMTVADKFYRMENVRQEDSTAPGIRTTQRGDVFNYLEIISETYGLTLTKQAQADYNGDPFMLEKRKAFSRLMIQLEQMFWFGTRDVATSSTNPEYHSGGFHYFLDLYSDTEIRDMSGSALTRAELVSFLNSVGRGGSPNKVLVGGKNALGIIDGFGFENVRVQDYRVGELGMNVKKIFGPFGEVQVVYEPLFDDMSAFAGQLAVLDMDHIKFRYLEGNGTNLDIKDMPQVLADGSLSKKGQYVGQVGWQFSTMKTMGLMKNVPAV